MTIKELYDLNFTADEFENSIMPFLTDVRVGLAKKAQVHFDCGRDHFKRGHDILRLVKDPARVLALSDAKGFTAVLDIYRAQRRAGKNQRKPSTKRNAARKR